MGKLQKWTWKTSRTNRLGDQNDSNQSYALLGCCCCCHCHQAQRPHSRWTPEINSKTSLLLCIILDSKSLMEASDWVPTSRNQRTITQYPFSKTYTTVNSMDIRRGFRYWAGFAVKNIRNTSLVSISPCCSEIGMSVTPHTHQQFSLLYILILCT